MARVAKRGSVEVQHTAGDSKEPPTLREGYYSWIQCLTCGAPGVHREPIRGVSFSAIAVGLARSIALASSDQSFRPSPGAAHRGSCEVGSCWLSGPDLAGAATCNGHLRPGRRASRSRYRWAMSPAAAATGMYMRSLPVGQAVIPASGTIYSIATEVVRCPGT